MSTQERKHNQRKRSTVRPEHESGNPGDHALTAIDETTATAEAKWLRTRQAEREDDSANALNHATTRTTLSFWPNQSPLPATEARQRKLKQQ